MSETLRALNLSRSMERADSGEVKEKNNCSTARETRRKQSLEQNNLKSVWTPRKSFGRREEAGSSTITAVLGCKRVPGISPNQSCKSWVGCACSKCHAVPRVHKKNGRSIFLCPITPGGCVFGKPWRLTTPWSFGQVSVRGWPGV